MGRLVIRSWARYYTSSGAWGPPHTQVITSVFSNRKTVPCGLLVVRAANVGASVVDALWGCITAGFVQSLGQGCGAIQLQARTAQRASASRNTFTTYAMGEPSWNDLSFHTVTNNFFLQLTN